MSSNVYTFFRRAGTCLGPRRTTVSLPTPCWSSRLRWIGTLSCATDTPCCAARHQQACSSPKSRAAASSFGRQVGTASPSRGQAATERADGECHANTKMPSMHAFAVRSCTPKLALWTAKCICTPEGELGRARADGTPSSCDVEAAWRLQHHDGGVPAFAVDRDAVLCGQTVAHFAATNRADGCGSRRCPPASSAQLVASPSSP